MSFLDLLLLGGLLVFAAAWIVRPRRAGRTTLIAAGLLAAAALAQALIEGLTWQFFVAYGLFAASLALGLLDFERRPRLRLVARVGLAALTLATLAPFAILPAPALAKPHGSYAVGSEVFRWVDASRSEAVTPDPADRRNVIVQAWYPAAPGAQGAHPLYIDGLGRLPPQISVLPGFFLSTYGRVDTHAVSAAAVSPARPRWPVVLFSPGYGAPRAFYTGLAADLASRGYVVLALDHAYESAVTELADGRIAAAVAPPMGHDDGHSYMASQQEVRAADARFVLDQLARPGGMGPRLSGRLDTDHIAMIGHSFGGAAAAQTMLLDPRVKAGANLDGTLYGRLPEAHLGRPFMVLQSDPDETHHSQLFNDGNAALLANLGAPAWRFRILHANHFSFTDAPNFLAPPARFALALLIGGRRGPDDTQAASVDILDAFLAGPLSGRSADPARAAAEHAGIVGGPVP